jgi:chemotaxis methyl-accepting protein methylase/signal transduction histidine kinase
MQVYCSFTPFATELPLAIRKVKSSRQKPTAIVVLGGSAGGLEAFAKILSGVEKGRGFAFVILQHLDPKHHSHLAEILGSSSGLKVQAVTKRTRPRANQVYVMPAEFRLCWKNGWIEPELRRQREKRFYAIDLFLKSLAPSEDIPRVAVLLSGLNADGTEGLRTFRAGGGHAIVLDPKFTEYPIMPSSAIQAGEADEVLSPDGIIRALNKFDPASAKPSPDEARMAGVLKLLQTHSGVDFADYKTPTLLRRIQRRMNAVRVKDPAAYAARLRRRPAELRQLFEEVTIHVTEFFRDAEAFQVLQTQVLRALLREKKKGEPLRIWTVGCATGEEAYSVAICALEMAEAMGKKNELQLFATDVSEQSILQAREGLFSPEAVGKVPAHLKAKYFRRAAGGYRVSKKLRHHCVFARQDLNSDPSFSRMDLITCRNVLIYLTPTAQKRAFRNFHRSLRESGFLFLGSAESSNAAGTRFKSFHQRARIYRRAAGKEKDSGIPARLTNRRSALSLPSGMKASLKLAERVLAETETSKDQSAPALARRLKVTRRHFQNLIENQSSLYEELQATHEEVLATNEELQTKNEEFVTAQEELQAANEELRTLNDEMMERNSQIDLVNRRLKKLAGRLRRSEAYSSSIVETVREPLLILDDKLRVVSANNSFYRTFGVQVPATKGQFFHKLGNGQWNIPDLRRLLEQVLPAQRVINDFEVCHVFPGIGSRTMLLNAREILGQQKNARLILLAIEDITERASQRNELRLARDTMEEERNVSRTDAAELRLERSMREKFVLALSHDLRNPLTGAKLSAQLLLRRAGNDENTVRTVQRIVDNMNRADRMIVDLLDANRIRAGQGIDLNRVPVEFVSLVRSELGNLAVRYGDRLRWELPETPVHGQWDPDAIRRILENLVGNAFKYGLEPEPVDVVIRAYNAHAELSVHNEGAPISAEDQKSLFDQFRRAVKPGSKEGWGLGLTLVKGLAEAQEGWVSVESSAERGTTFTVSFATSPADGA